MQNMDNGDRESIKSDVIHDHEDGRHENMRTHTTDNMNNVEEALEGQNRFKLLLKLLIFIPFKLNKGSLWISIPSFIWMVLNCLKLAYITELAFTVGACRGKLSSDIIHGHLTLRHALLQGWEASYETPPFPPSIGSFAIYSIEDFKTRINYSVSQYYNIHEHTTGVFEILTNDKLTLEFKYFEYEAGQIVPKGVTFNPGPGLTNRTVDGVIVYSYNVMADLKNRNLEDIFKRILQVNIKSSLHSIRVRFNSKKITCFAIAVNVTFDDDDHNGQVVIDLKTDTRPISCRMMAFNVTDNGPLCPDLNPSLLSLCFGFTTAAIVGDATSFLVSMLILIILRVTWMKIGGGICFQPQPDTFTLSKLSYFFQCWLVIAIAGDGFILRATEPLFNAMTHRDVHLTLPLYDGVAFNIGMGCLLCWISILRFSKINVKLSLLFRTLYYSFWNVFAFMLCAAVLFVGFFACAYVSLGVYHVKFESQARTAETLFALINGDDLFNTFAGLDEKNAASTGRG
ncbi:mucolipin-3-like isoform X2 [Mya arenaria]|uniref:mucolipin-3-like isoform X2 n=1 Tax=Mya arenaria TaxID=6604 RepID=UPI0022E90FC6|nr:mucolipin-3-like isoform X2 [Mya arenaria]